MINKRAKECNITEPLLQNQGVLVVDDNELARDTVSNILSFHKFSVICAENGKDGLDKYQERPCSIVVTDILMPEIEGIEMIKKLRKIDSEVKILAISGGGSTQNMTFLKLAQKLGADATLRKPFRASELLRKVVGLLR